MALLRVLTTGEGQQLALDPKVVCNLLNKDVRLQQYVWRHRPRNGRHHWRADLSALRAWVTSLTNEVQTQQLEAHDTEHGDSHTGTRRTDNFLRHLKARGPGEARTGRVTELWDVATNTAVRNEADRMRLLSDSWQEWWGSPLTCDHEDLRAWLQDLDIPPPDDWQWRPRVEQMEEAIRSSPGTSAGWDDIPYAAWKALLRDSQKGSSERGRWVAGYFLDLLDGLSSSTPQDLPQDLNDLLCHVLGKAPKHQAPDGSLKRTAADTRIIEVGNTENRILARAVCFVLTRGPVGSWFDADQYAWLPGRHGLTAVTRMDTAMKVATLDGHEGPAGFGDLEKAFPSVLLDGLWALLEHWGAPAALRTFLNNLYTNVRRYARGQESTYDWGTSRRGLKTGCGLSTVLLLFAMLVLGVALRRHFRLRDEQALTVLFADDFAWTTRTWAGWAQLNGLFQRLRRVLGLTVNWSKTLAVCRAPPADPLVRGALYRDGWQQRNFVRRGLHLGVLQGHEVTEEERWEAPLQKLEERATLHWDRRRFSETERARIWQVWLETVLSYIPLRYTTPVLKRVLATQNKWYGAGWYSSRSGRAGAGLYGVPLAMHDPEWRNVVRGCRLAMLGMPVTFNTLRLHLPDRAQQAVLQGRHTTDDATRLCSQALVCHLTAALNRFRQLAGFSAHWVLRSLRRHEDWRLRDDVQNNHFLQDSDTECDLTLYFDGSQEHNRQTWGRTDGGWAVIAVYRGEVVGRVWGRTLERYRF